MSIRVLRAGLDTVEVSYGGEISADAAATLDRLKELAQATESPQPFAGGLHDIFVQPKAFSLWRWRLANRLFSVVARPKANAGGVLAQVRYSAFGLANESIESLQFHVRLCLDALGSLSELTVSRADVCVDFQGWSPSLLDMKNIVCPASYRGTHGTEKEVETHQFGVGTLLRVYNKTAEIAHSKKIWVPGTWEMSSDYDKNEPVWRIEYQAKREVLKELGISSSVTLSANPSALLDYGLRWAQLRVPDGGKNKTRWPEDPRWTALRSATFDGKPLNRIVRPSSVMSLDRAAGMLIGAAATAGAYFGTRDYMSALQQLSFVAEIQMKEKEIDFPAKVADKERRILSGSD